MIARTAEQQKLVNRMSKKSGDTINCEDITDLDVNDYNSCTITFDNNIAIVNLEGKGKFKNYNICHGTKDKASITREECEDIEESLVYLSPDWKYSVFEAINNEILASETSNTLFDINPTPLYEQNFQTNLVEIECNGGYLMGQVDFYTTKNVPSGITSNPYVDVSLGNDNTVKAYYKENSLLISPCSNTLYNVYIVGDGIIVFPEDSSELFAYLEIAKEINFNNSVDTSNVTNMSHIFNLCTSLEELDVIHFDTSNVTDMSGMFGDCNEIEILDVSGFDTSNVTDMSDMFSYCTSLGELDLSGFDTSNVTNMEYMFCYCTSLEELDLSNFDTSNVTDMSCMFGYCARLETIYVSNNWNTSKVTNSTSMFEGCYRIVGGDGTRFDSNYIDKTRAHVDGGPSNPGYLTLKTN